MKIEILYGTETGNAEMLADDVAASLADRHTVNCTSLADTDPGALAEADLNLILCSSYGDGEMPASAKPFAARLEAIETLDPAPRVAVFGLGDSEYAETYGQAPKTLAAMLGARGAQVLGDVPVHDASGEDEVEEIAIPWAAALLE
ncbi:flavodoxin family protein [Palleronia sp. LCG004]|uniref:flavodoxin family protein n=1 Tax=Palleronia sp. LCG004 TaxID=3079304 RepID=UPI002942BB6B|nr:flavodoxin family protein [Palleronia sp. LCG004]WOI57859.1 flavodoxin family protein [Palleronia sp. LCG004]